MKNSNKRTPDRKLVVKKETLRQLATDELEQVNGGYLYVATKNNCTGKYSGCISQC
jgi:hypothetical protein